MAGDPYEFMRWAGWKSAEVAETFTGDPDQIQELVDKHELVLAVWKDDQYPEANGYDVLIIKGRPRFIAGHFDTSGSWTAIPCTGPSQAEAIQLCVRTGVRMGSADDDGIADGHPSSGNTRETNTVRTMLSRLALLLRSWMPTG
jgi:hypothetical protein